jgi:hypothetical protein
MGHPKEIREAARKMRYSGEAIDNIAQTLGIAKSTVRFWVRDISLTPDQVASIKQNQRKYLAQQRGAEANRLKFRALREQYQQVGRLRARHKSSPLHLMGCMLYWAEGAKHRNNFYFANSDPEMQRLWIRFLKEELDVRTDEIAVHLLLHTFDVGEIRISEEYWLEVLELPRSCLRKTIYKSPGSVRKNRLSHGVAGIRVGRSDLVQHVFGAIQEYTGIHKPEWID